MNNIDEFDLPRSEWERLIDEYIFNERNRKILKRRWLDGICFDALAEEFNLSAQQIKTIVYKSSCRVFKHIIK